MFSQQLFRIFFFQFLLHLRFMPPSISDILFSCPSSPPLFTLGLTRAVCCPYGLMPTSLRCPLPSLIYFRCSFRRFTKEKIAKSPISFFCFYGNWVYCYKQWFVYVWVVYACMWCICILAGPVEWRHSFLSLFRPSTSTFRCPLSLLLSIFLSLSRVAAPSHSQIYSFLPLEALHLPVLTSLLFHLLFSRILFPPSPFPLFFSELPLTFFLFHSF